MAKSRKNASDYREFLDVTWGMFSRQYEFFWKIRMFDKKKGYMVKFLEETKQLCELRLKDLENL